MKMKLLKLFKRTISVVAAVALMSGAMLTVEARGVETKADDSVIYEAFTDYSQYKEDNADKKLIPECQTAGYVFGGWFTKSETEDKYTPIEEMSKASGTIYAKFVPARVLSVKCQNVAGTNSNSGNAIMKVVSALDTLNYQSYGFEMDVVTLDNENTFAGSQKIRYEYNLKKAYTKFNVYKDSEGTQLVKDYEPGDLFGPAAKYFTTYGVKDIPQGSFGAIICIRPYWKTIDGTEVYGLTKYAHVEDGYLTEDGFKYVNVPVNLRKMETGVAAGVLNVNYSNAKNGVTLKFAEVEGGRFFDEMAWADKGTSVKMVGNTSDISDKNANDIYANIRFKVKVDDVNTILSGYTFAVDGEDFSNSGETQTTPNVWDVFY